MVVRMHHLMRQRVLQVAPVPHRIAADQDAMLGVEPPALALDAAVRGQTGGAPAAQDVGGVHAAAVVELGDAVVEEQDGGRVGEQPVAEVLGAAHVAGLVGAEARLAVVEHAFGRDAAGEDVEVGDPPFGAGVEAGAGGVVFEVGVGFGG